MLFLKNHTSCSVRHEGEAENIAGKYVVNWKTADFIRFWWNEVELKWKKSTNMDSVIADLY